MKQSIEEFIRDNIIYIDSVIKKAVPNARIDNDEREMWILNDENLYLFAVECGVDI